MSSVSMSTLEHLDSFCAKLYELNDMRFAGIINSMGNLIAGGFKNSLEPYASKSRQNMMFMQLILEIKMRKEFDDILGKVNYMHSSRQKVNMLSIPKDNFVIVLSLDKNADVSQVVEHVEKAYDSQIKLDSSQIKSMK